MKFKKIIMIVATLTVLGCTSNQIVQNDIYTTENITYNVLTNKPVNGVVVKELFGYKEYYTYKMGKLQNYKSVDHEGNLVEEKEYDSMGLLNGRIKNGKNYATYSHGILMGISKRGSTVEMFHDGVLNGRQESNGNIKYYHRGIESKEEIDTPIFVDKKVKWGEIPKKNYTGEIYSRPISDKFIPKHQRSLTLKVEGYENGILVYVKYYSEKGEKIGEKTFYKGDVNTVLKYSKYTNGKLDLAINYNSEGDLDGETIEQFSGNINVVNNSNGILHGEVSNKNLYSNTIIKKGIYNLGVFSGEEYGTYYLDGIEVDRVKGETISLLELIDLSEAKASSGFIKRKEGDYTFIDHYSDGQLVKSYKFFVNNLEMITIPQNEGYYIEEIYNKGLLKSRFTYNSKGEREGEFLSIEHKGSKTMGKIENGGINGKSRHYHGDKIFYIDEYKNGSSYTRTVYYNYEENNISGRSKGVYSEELESWIMIGEAYEYYEDGSISVKKDYGRDLTLKKNVKYTEYYKNGVIQKRYTKDYCGSIFLGEYDYYSDSGKLLSKWIYNEKGHRVNVKEFDKDGNLTKNIIYDELGRELKR